MAEESESPASSTGTPKPFGSSDGPGWLRTATGMLALLATLTGIGVSVYGLMQKSLADRETAKQNKLTAEQKAESDNALAATNLQIAKDQLALRQEELRAQADQHAADQTFAREQSARDQRNKEEDRLSTVVDNLFSAKGTAEANLDLLSTFMIQNHAYDEQVGNAIVARAPTLRSHSEVAVAFAALRKLDPATKVDALAEINRAARARLDDALVDEFWKDLAELLEQNGSVRKIVDTPYRGPGWGYAFFAVVQAAADRAWGEVGNVPEYDPDRNTDLTPELNSNPAYSYFIGFLRAAVNDEVSPYFNLQEELHTINRDPPMPLEALLAKPEWAQMKELAEAKRRKRRVENEASTMELSLDMLRRSSDMLPGVLLQLGREAPVLVPLEKCFFWPSKWPSGTYPTLDLLGAYLDRVDLSSVQFDMETWRSLLPHEFASQTVTHVDGERHYDSTLLLSYGADFPVPAKVNKQWPEMVRQAKKKRGEDQP